MTEQVLLKLAGSVLIISATTLAGFFYSKRAFIREEQLLEMKKALSMLKSEIRFKLSTFGEAAISISERVKSPVSDIFLKAGEKASSRNGGEAFEIWETAVKSIEQQSFYTKEDIEAFNSMGKNLGYLDKEMQGQSVDLLIEYIDAAVLGIKESSAKQSKMYRSLGLLSGLLIAVIML